MAVMTAGDQREQEDDQDERQGRAPRAVLGRVEAAEHAGVDVDLLRQRGIGPVEDVQFADDTMPIVKSKGAVSPATRATPRRAPLTIPGAALGNTTRRIVCALRVPSA